MSREWGSFRALYLYGTRVGDSGMASLGHLQALEELSLTATQVGDRALRHLAGAGQDEEPVGLYGPFRQIPMERLQGVRSYLAFYQRAGGRSPGSGLPLGQLLQRSNRSYLVNLQSNGFGCLFVNFFGLT